MTGLVGGLGPCWEGTRPCSDQRIHRSYLDMAKVVVFHYLFWVVLVVVFITGTTRISLFGLGYVLACFYLLLSGTAMLRKPARSRLALWDCLILYNIAVIISKNMLSVRADPRASPRATPNCKSKAIPTKGRGGCI